jgi:hypothetical protein
MVGKGYEQDEDHETKYGFSYAHASDDRSWLDVDILQRPHVSSGKVIWFYWFRVNTRTSHLMRRSLGDPALEMYEGWILFNPDELADVMEEDVSVLEANLSQST